MQNWLPARSSNFPITNPSGANRRAFVIRNFPCPLPMGAELCYNLLKIEWQKGADREMRIQEERISAEEYIAFLKRTDLGSQYPKERFENRIAKLEELCKQMNTNISSLQSLVTALQNNDYVTGVTPITKNGETIGYTITFTKSEVALVRLRVEF